MSDLIIPVQGIAVINNALKFASSIKELIISNNSELINANEQFKTVSKIEKELEKKRKEIKKPYADNAKKVDAEFKVPKNAISNAKEKIGNAIAKYKKELEIKAEEERRKRKEEERKRQEEAEQAAINKYDMAEELRSQGKENEAIQAEIEADLAMIDRVINKSVPVDSGEVKLKGTTTRDNWKFEVTDREKFVKYCIKENFFEWLMPDVSYMSFMARKFKKECEYPGGRIYNDFKLINTRSKAE